MTELELYQFIGHRLPQLPRASGIANRILKPLYNRKLRGPVLSEVSGRKMQLDPRENVDGGLLFCPQLYDYAEIRFLLQTLNDDDVFVDIGAHIGFYSLIASKKIHRGKILAVEANPATYQKLQHNIALNSPPIDVVNVGVSDRKERLKLSGNSNNTAGQSFLIDAPDGVEVQCYPLADILENRGIGNITVIKFDVEGYEYKVLKPYLAQVDRARLPRYIISEFFEAHVDKTTGNQIELLKAYGYREIMKTDENRILVRSDH